MEMRTINIYINCVTIFLHVSSLITAICCFLLIIYRWNYNYHRRQHISIIAASPFDDSITLLLFGNTYFVLILYGVTWLSVLVRTISGDFSILKNMFSLNDAVTCRVQAALIYFLISALFHSYLLQASRCFFRVVFHGTLNEKKLWHFPLNHVSTYILLILSTWLISIVILIPAVRIFDVFSYFPEQYHCLISFTNIGGFTYSVLSAYIIPVFFIIYIYSRLMIFIHHMYQSNDVLRAKRQTQIVKRILTICLILSLTGSQTIFFLFHFIITNRVHPLADRVHELGVAVSTNVVTIGFAYLNSFFKLLPTRSFA